MEHYYKVQYCYEGSEVWFTVEDELETLKEAMRELARLKRRCKETGQHKLKFRVRHFRVQTVATGKLR